MEKQTVNLMVMKLPSSLIISIPPNAVMTTNNEIVILFGYCSYMVNNSSSRKRYASPKAGTELYLDLVFRQ